MNPIPTDINEKRRNDLRKRLLESRSFQQHPSALFTRRPVLETAEEKRKDIENQEKIQDIKLKKVTLLILFAFLSLETIVIFSFAVFQATGRNNFHLEEWSFKLLATATILQITYMLQVAVKHLFPSQTK